MRTIKAQQYVEDAYRTYGQHVIGHRAVADYRDGLKPVQRRILWAMHELGLVPEKNFAKSARTVGDVLGKYHPANDSSVYDSLVGLVNAHYPVVQGEGNFGTLTDPPAAYRYTLARLDRNAALLLGNASSAEMTQNFDGTREEPLYLPAELPWLLLNGSSGIAVGIAAEIPPHNFDEVVAALRYCIKAGDKADLAGVLACLQGPDYGAGVLLSNAAQLKALYETGEGQLSYRCAYRVTDDALTITAYAPRFNIGKFIETCQRAVEAGNLVAVTDESSADNGIKLVVSYTNARFVRDHIVPLLDTTISYRFYVNENTETEPRTMKLDLTSFLAKWLDFRRQTETKVLEKEREHQNEILARQTAKVVAAQHVKKLAEILAKGSEDLAGEVATTLKVTSQMAELILDIPLRTLNRLNVKDLSKDVDATNQNLAEIETKLKTIDKVLLRHLDEITKQYGEHVRGTQVGTKRPRFNVPDDVPATWLIGTYDGDVTRLEGSPLDRRGGLKYDMAVQVGAQFWAVMQTGQMVRVDTASLSVAKPRAFGKLAGLVPTSTPRIAVMDEDGNGIVLEQSQLGKDRYQVLKTTVPVRCAVGLPAGARLLAANDEVAFVHADVPTTRVNSSGWKFLPKRKNGATILQVVGSHALVDGKLQTIKSDESFEYTGALVATPTVLVEWAEGKDMLSLSDVVTQAKTRKLVRIVPIQ